MSGDSGNEERVWAKKAREVAGNLYKMGLDIEKIAQAVGYAVETVNEWLGLEKNVP